MKNFIIFFIFLFLLCSSSTYAQTITDSNLTKCLDSLIATQFKLNEPGIAVLIASKDGIIYKKAFGSANLELNVPMQPDMVFRIGSITKQFTALAFYNWLNKEKFPCTTVFKNSSRIFLQKLYPITIENLLTHTSGIIDYPSMNDPDPYIERRDFTPQFLINYFKNEPLQSQPGTKVQLFKLQLCFARLHYPNGFRKNIS